MVNRSNAPGPAGVSVNSVMPFRLAGARSPEAGVLRGLTLSMNSAERGARDLFDHDLAHHAVIGVPPGSTMPHILQLRISCNSPCARELTAIAPLRSIAASIGQKGVTPGRISGEERFSGEGGVITG